MFQIKNIFCSQRNSKHERVRSDRNVSMCFSSDAYIISQIFFVLAKLYRTYILQFKLCCRHLLHQMVSHSHLFFSNFMVLYWLAVKYWQDIDRFISLFLFPSYIFQRCHCHNPIYGICMEYYLNQGSLARKANLR